MAEHDPYPVDRRTLADLRDELDEDMRAELDELGVDDGQEVDDERT